jgi:Icc-related predicted phosphoesterase
MIPERQDYFNSLQPNAHYTLHSQERIIFSWNGRDVQCAGEDAIADFERTGRNAGFYPARVTPDEQERLDRDEAERVTLFEATIRREFARWMDIAAEKASSDVSVYIIAGNDDPWFIDEVLSETQAVTYCDGQTVKLGEHEMVSLSYANPTPWDSPRELPEDELFNRIDALATTLTDPERAIFNLHVPPYGSGLDDAPLLEADFTPRTRMGQVETGPVGSTAVRRAIESYQPMVGLHGHIHESRGIARIGRTVVVNPGSEYSTGRIHGVLLQTKKGTLKTHQLVVG